MGPCGLDNDPFAPCPNLFGGRKDRLGIKDVESYPNSLAFQSGHWILQHDLLSMNDSASFHRWTYHKRPAIHIPAHWAVAAVGLDAAPTR